MKCIYILFSLVLIISLGIGEGELLSVPFYTRLEITQGNPGLNEEFTLTHSLIALVDLPETRMIFEIPNGIELIDGIPVRNFNPSINDSIPLSVNLKIAHPGSYCITCHTVVAPRDTIFLLQHFAKDIYILSTVDTIIHQEIPTDGPYYNLVSDSVIGEKPVVLPPEGTNYTVSGTVRYRNKLTNQPDPLPDIKVELSGWHYRDSTWTNSSGYYSITAPSGEYDLIIWAVNKAGEVHECWRADVDFIPPNADLYCSPFPHFFLSQEINLYSNLLINYNAEADKADWARILWRIKRDKDWMYNHTSPHRTLDYIEVSYPAEICIDLPWPWPNEIFVLERNPFYVYFGELEAVKVKAHDYSWLG